MFFPFWKHSTKQSLSRLSSHHRRSPQPTRREGGNGQAQQAAQLKRLGRDRLSTLLKLRCGVRGFAVPSPMHPALAKMAALGPNGPVKQRHASLNASLLVCRETQFA